ncbi:MAG: hypothetical protein FJ137_10135 [Deltaproteobacteria bacterium]|nr:hypothetical protein [Deltaproteobacteria bacterium]
MIAAGWRRLLVLVGLALAGPTGTITVAGCAHAPRFPAVHALNDASVATRLQVAAARRHAVDGVAKAGLPGVGGAVASVTVDVIAAAPDRLMVAVRSFFEAPQQIVVAHGDVVTLYDATAGSPQFLRGPADEGTLRRVLGLPLLPDDAVALLLGRAPVDAVADRALPRVRLVAVDDDDGTYTARVERDAADRRGAWVVTARVTDDALVGVVVEGRDGRALVRARCSDFVEVGGAAFARRLELTLVDAPAGGPGVVVLSLPQATWNPASLPEGAFVLEPPPDVVVHPL